MTKDNLIKKVLDSAVSGSKKEAEDAIEEYLKYHSVGFLKYLDKCSYWLFKDMVFGNDIDGAITIDTVYNNYLKSTNDTKSNDM